jgi:FtsP/CotA-like multicopper oxidase with cupredoxin domain
MERSTLSRRRFLAIAGTGVAAAGGAGLLLASRDGTPSPVGPNSPRIAAVEQRRRGRSAPITRIAITAAPLAAASETWAYGGAIPGTEIRLPAGGVLQARFTNDLPEPTTIHWHGVALRNDMDGVPDVTQGAVAPGARFDYEFAVPDPGTYFFHPHVGTQLDRGLYAPLIVEDPAEPGDYDREVVLVLDDWLAGADPDEVLDELRGGMAGMDMSAGGHTSMAMGAGTSATAGMLGDDIGDVDYPTFVINGRPPGDPFTIDARQGERIRLRIINAASDRPFRFAIGGLRLTVTHSDGFPVEPVTGDALLIGMGERYDVTVEVDVDGAAPIVAVPEGTSTGALAVLRTTAGRNPSADIRPNELDGRLLTSDDLRATAAVALPDRAPDRVLTYRLGGDMSAYRWTVSGPRDQIREGERVRLRLENTTMMFHPMHLHGHTFELRVADGRGARKDTAIIRPGATIEADFEADNPGQWALHCHNIYHAESGMVAVLSYVS